MGRNAIVLAAGLGTRMKSKHHKVLHEVCGKPMVLHILDALDHLTFEQKIVVVGQQREAVEAVISSRAQTAYQDEQLGTGHAVLCAADALNRNADTTVILYGDAPLITPATLERLLSEREQQDASVCVLTAEVREPFGLGRVIVNAAGHVERIVEEKDATPSEREIRLINTGIYAFRTTDLLAALSQLKPDNAQGEYYLTDTIEILRSAGKKVVYFTVPNEDEIASVNDRVQLAHVEQILRKRICEHWARQGVTIINPEHTYIGLDVTIGQDTVLMPGTVLEGNTTIGEDCVIGPNTRLQDAILANAVTVEQSVVIRSSIGSDTTVGPFAYIRPGSVIGEHVKVGDFVEIKNSQLGDNTKVSHLAYVGDADIGSGVNVGCGVVTVNYDGERKHRTVVGDHSFVGSNVNLIAPVTVGEGSYVCAGSTITDNVPDDGFAIARARQVTKPDYVKKWKTKQSDENQK